MIPRGTGFTYKQGGDLVKNVNYFAGGLAFVVGLGGHFSGDGVVFIFIFIFVFIPEGRG